MSHRAAHGELRYAICHTRYATMLQQEKITQAISILQELDLDAWLSDGPVAVRVTGDSMEPFLSDGDTVFAVRVSRAELAAGDIVIFRSGDALVVHRLLAKTESTFLEMGESRACGVEHPWPRTMGRIRSVRRGEIERGLDSEGERRAATARARILLSRHRVETFAARIQDKIHDLQKHADPLLFAPKRAKGSRQDN